MKMLRGLGNRSGHDAGRVSFGLPFFKDSGHRRPPGCVSGMAAQEGMGKDLAAPESLRHLAGPRGLFRASGTWEEPRGAGC